jgi:hypothetical protein
MLPLPLDASRCMTREAVPTPICIEEFATHIQNTLARSAGVMLASPSGSRCSSVAPDSGSRSCRRLGSASSAALTAPP